MNDITFITRSRNVLQAVCLFLVLCLPVVSQAAGVFLQTPVSRLIAGKVVDHSTGEAIAYASVGIVGEVPGTVCNADGKFSFTVPNNLNSKTVLFSALGYQPMEMKVEALLTAKGIHKSVQVALIPKPLQLAEVKVKANKWKTRKLGGNTGPVAMVHHNFIIAHLPVQENFGNEMGIQINSGRKPVFLQVLNFCLTNNQYEMVKFRVNLYAVKDDLPCQNISPGNIYATVQNKEQGWIAVDLEPYHLYLEHDFVITLEWIDCLPRNKSLPLTIWGTIPGFHTIFHKDTSQGYWRKLPPMGIGMNIVVLREK